MTSAQLSEWEAYDSIDPVGTWRDDFRMAYLSSLVVNTARSIHGKRGIQMTSPIDFMPAWDEDSKFSEPVKKQSTEEMKQILLSIASAQNKKVMTRSKPPVKRDKK